MGSAASPGRQTSAQFVSPTSPLLRSSSNRFSHVDHIQIHIRIVKFLSISYSCLPSLIFLILFAPVIHSLKLPPSHADQASGSSRHLRDLLYEVNGDDFILQPDLRSMAPNWKRQPSTIENCF